MIKRSWLTVLLALLIAGVSLGAAAVPTDAGGAWYAEYFANRYLAGTPAITRYEDTLHFEWGYGSPGSGVPADDFSARWTRDEWFEAGTYRFSYRSDDGIRIWVGDIQVVDDWRDRQAAWSSVDLFIPRGTYRVRVEHYEHSGAAAIQVAWERLTGGGTWRGEYFDNNDLAGAPVLVSYDPAIDFDWGSGSPSPEVPADDFSVRWTRTLGFTPGTYRFHASCDDGVRIYVDGKRIVDAWYKQKLPNTRSGDVTLGNGQHSIVVEYFERGGQASAHVWWNRLGAFGDWEGRYYDNPELRGGPALIRDDAEINFDWGEGPPVSWMPADSFSVVWSRQVDFAPGYYRLYVQSDDGVRVWIDDALVMDYWRPMNYEWHYLNWTYLDGPHTVKVEYFEQAGNARGRFWWERAADPDAPLPTPFPIPTEGQESRYLHPPPPPSVCQRGPLSLDVWSVGKVCTSSGWTATVFIEGHGGDCRYTYAWERQVKGGPLPGSMTFEVKSAGYGTAIVGEASVTSAGQTVVVGLHIPPPRCP